MADDMTIDEVAAEYGVSRSTVERAINDGILRWHDGYNEDRRPVTMIEAEDALHWWNARKPRRKRRVRATLDGRRAAVTILDAGAAADDDADEDDAGNVETVAVAAADGHAVAVEDVLLAIYRRALWEGIRIGRQSAAEATRAVIGDLAGRVASEREHAVRERLRAEQAEAALAQQQAARPAKARARVKRWLGLD